MALSEKTLIIIKNEAVRRRLVGRIIQQFEDVGFKIITIKMVTATLEQARKHYNMGSDEKWLIGVGNKAREIYNNNESKILKLFKTSKPIQIGEIIYKWSVKQLAGKPIVILILQGPLAVNKTKIIVGSTLPSEADLSTIRGKFASDSIERSNHQKRALHNVVHRSSSITEARREISVWFPKIVD